METVKHTYNNSGLGNLTYKKADGSVLFAEAVYGGNNAGPHALSSATTAPGVFPAEEQSMRYNAFDKVTSITEGDKSLQITYGHHRQRIGQQYTAAGSTTTKVYVGACEYITKRGETTIHTYLSGPEGLFAVVVKEPKCLYNIQYIHTDHLGSWNTISDAAGNRLQEINFDAWGNRRDPNTWQIISNFSQPLLFDRGFTGHEHLTEFNLINMNGRVYDPTILRFLSPDPFIQAPDYSQSFNRYSYVMNNPMNLTDKSGFYWEDYDVIPPGLGLDPEKDRAFIEYLESSGFLLDQVEVVTTRLDMSSDEFGTQFWLFHDGFGFDMEYDEEYTENTTHNSWENSSSQEGKAFLPEKFYSEKANKGDVYVDDKTVINIFSQSVTPKGFTITSWGFAVLDIVKLGSKFKDPLSIPMVYIEITLQLEDWRRSEILEQYNNEPNGRAGLIMRYNESIQDWNGYLHNEIGTTLIDASTGRVYGIFGQNYLPR